MTIKEIQELVKLIDKSDLAEFQLKNKDVEIKIRSKHFYNKVGAVQQEVTTSAPVITSPAASVPAPVVTSDAAPAVSKPQEAKSSYIEIKSPMVGTFYRSSSPDKPPFVSVGDTVQKGSPVCIVEAMKLFNEIESEVSGTIVKVMVEDASPVEYDQVLFLVEA
jgi:acetyl-CoA carboxylase biotin carboxyl carrier protein